ncbi:MAG TPA: catalase, partial [Candidatus Limnocylindria bacterium]|nr:catalase [Candidatus Limnocylindria bacterium]
MSSDFVRYSDEIETIDPHIDELMAQIIEYWEKTVRESPRTEGTGHAVRGAHPKSYGVVKAEVEILRDVPAAYAQGIYAKPGHHGALIRFSNGALH